MSTSFILGFLTGAVSAILLFMFVIVCLAYFRTRIEGFSSRLEKNLKNAGPHESGAIFLPEDESEIARKKHIKKNSEQGKDTPFSELRDK